MRVRVEQGAAGVRGTHVPPADDALGQRSHAVPFMDK